MVGLNEKHIKDIIKKLLNNDYVIVEKNILQQYHLSKKSNLNFLFKKQIYRLSQEYGVVCEIDNDNFNNTSFFNFEEIYIYFKSPNKDNSFRIQLKYFMDNFNFYFPNTKRHIILEKKL
jgi:hypothetical protein